MVKDKAKRNVLKRSQEPFESRQELGEAVHKVEQELKPEGLKSLKIKPKKDKEGKFGILAEASEEEEITEVEVESGKNAAGPYGLEPLDPEEAGIPSTWLKHPPPASDQ